MIPVSLVVLLLSRGNLTKIRRKVCEECKISPQYSDGSLALNHVKQTSYPTITTTFKDDSCLVNSQELSMHRCARKERKKYIFLPVSLYHLSWHLRHVHTCWTFITECSKLKKSSTWIHKRPLTERSNTILKTIMSLVYVSVKSPKIVIYKHALPKSCFGKRKYQSSGLDKTKLLKVLQDQLVLPNFCQHKIFISHHICDRA